MNNERMAEIGHLIATQDNRATQAPIFAVQERRRIYGLGLSWADDMVWMYDDEDGDGPLEATPEEAEKLNRAHRFYFDIPEGWEQVGYADVWEFVTGCFTEQGCKDYLAANGHNHRETRIYAYGSYRNAEWQDVREHLKGLAE